MLKMQQANFQTYLNEAVRAAEAANQILLKYYGKLRQVSEKVQAGLVSEADHEAEEAIRSLLLSRFKDHRFVGEETGMSGVADADHIWYVDPLDGTTNYVYGFPAFCTSIGLEIKGALAVGVIMAPKLNLRLWATAGGGAFCNDQKIQVSGRRHLREGLFATGFNLTGKGLESQLKLVDTVLRSSRGIRRTGSAALDLSWVAQGVFDVFWEQDLAPWDMAAGALIAAEAGAAVTNYDGLDYQARRDRHIIAGTPLIQGELIKLAQHVLSPTSKS